MLKLLKISSLLIVSIMTTQTNAQVSVANNTAGGGAPHCYALASD